MTENEKKVLANVEGLVRWLEDYQKIKFGVSGDLAGSNLNLINYFSDFHQEFNNFERTADEDELLNKMKKSQVIFFGDIHHLWQSQKFTAELIEKLCFCDPSLKILTVEFIYANCQKSLDAYQSGKISEKTFLQKIYFKNWSHHNNWKWYKTILTVAQQSHIQVFGIHPCQWRRNQIEEDKLLVKNLKTIAEFTPADKWLIHIGEVHLAHSHLPKKILVLPIFNCKKTVKILINVPAVYFSALRRFKNFHLPKVLLIKKRVYHVMITPILTHYLSTIAYLEYTAGLEEGDNIWTDGDLILEIVRRWADLLEFNFIPERLSEFKVENFKELRLEKVLEELAGAVFGRSKSFLYFCSKLFIPERRPENKAERVGEKIFMNFLKGEKPVIPRI